MSAGQLLYSHTKPGRILVIKVFAVSQAFVWSYMGYVTYDLFRIQKTIPKTKLDKDAPTIDRFTQIVGQSSVTKTASWVAVGLGFVLTIGGALWARQSVKQIHLLNRNRISINTYGFPLERTFTLPVSEVQSVNPQESASYIRLRVVGAPLNYIVDRDGVFPMPKLFHAATAPSFNV